MNENVNYNMVLFDFKCAASAVCNNTEGFYNCTCTPGYTGNGTSCNGYYERYLAN